MKLLSSLALVGLVGFSSLMATEYQVDAGHSTVGFKVRHMMVASVRGEFKEYQGKYDYDPVKKVIYSLEGTVKIASIDTGDKKRDDHLRSKDFFDVEKFPEMTLKLLKHDGDKALVNLTMKNITKQIEFKVEDLSGESKDPWGNIRSGFELNGKINRKDFNIMFNKILETGGIAVGDEVRLNLEIAGIKAKEK